MKSQRNPISSVGRELVVRIRRMQREFALLDWPDTVRLAHGLSADSQLHLWWREVGHRLRCLSRAQYDRLVREDLEHTLRTAERARRLAPRV